MKKKIFGVALIATMAVAAGWNFNQSKNEVELSDLALANIEALAYDESGGGGSGSSKCPDSCKEWKGNSGGGIACDCGRYTGTCKNRC